MLNFVAEGEDVFFEQPEDLSSLSLVGPLLSGDDKAARHQRNQALDDDSHLAYGPASPTASFFTERRRRPRLAFVPFVYLELSY